MHIIRKALEGPIRQIAINAGRDGSEVLAALQGKSGVGYNAKTDKYENLFAAGVIDPTKVVRNALQSAASIAGMVLTTESLITDYDDEKDAKNEKIII